MQIYLEYVLIDNLVINGFILILTNELLKLEVKNLNIFLASLLGAVFALFVPLVVLPPTLLLVVKISVGLSIVSILKKFKNSLEFIVTFLTFLTLTFVMGGVCFAILNLLNAQVTNSGVLVYENEIPIGIILLVVIGYSYLMLNLIKNFYKKKSINNFLFKISIKNKGTIYKTTGFLDSGNRLVDEESQKPIVIINYKVFNKLFKNINVVDLLMERLENLPLKNCKYINVDTVSTKKSKMLVFESDELEIFLQSQTNIIQNVMLGLASAKLTNFDNFDVLLNPLLFNL